MRNYTLMIGVCLVIGIWSLGFALPSAEADTWSQTTFTDGTFSDTITTTGAADIILNCGSITFNYTGGQQTFVVPTGVTSINVDMAGASGGDSSAAGGKGGRVQTTLSVTPGSTLYIYVGGAGGWGGGYNGGGGSNWSGGGGGASDIRIGGTALGNRFVIAGGGGGGGYNSTNKTAGGGGGYPAGVTAGSTGSAIGGGGGTQSAGGTGGATGGTNGSSGLGGDGGSGGGCGGGGGGGGYYGGGGGGYNNTFPAYGAGGGGGSSCSSGTNTTYTSGYQSGNGQIIITYGQQAGTYISSAITPTGVSYWGVLTYTKTTPTNTLLTVDVLSSSNNSLLVVNVLSGTDLTATYPVTFTNITGIKLRCNFLTSDINQTPTLSDWGVMYVAGMLVTTTNWASMIPSGSSVAMGQSIAQVKFTMSVTGTGMALWKRFRIDKGLKTYTNIACPDSKIEVQVWMENSNNTYWDINDKLIAKGTFTNGTCYLNMNRWQVTTTSKTYYIVYKLAGDIGGGQRAGVKIVDSSYLEFENATCVGVPP